MARQRGVVKLDGTLDDITFQKTRDGYRAKMKSEVPASKISSDPAFERTRENNAEFGRAGKAGKLLRAALRTQIKRASDSRMVSRLTKEMMRVLQADATSDRGKRNVIDGEVELLEGFDFNVNGKLGTALYAPYTKTIDRATGACSVNLDPFTPAASVAAPAGTTHFRIFSAAAEVDFENEVFTVQAQETAVLPWDNNPTAVIQLANNLPVNSTLPLFLALGIEFMQEINGKQYPLKNGAFNGMGLVKVSGV
jgi:hypothetical protein